MSASKDPSEFSTNLLEAATFDTREEAEASFLADAKVASDTTVQSATGGEVHAATQRDRLLRYLRETCDIDIANLKASEVTEWLESDDLDPTVRILLEERLQAGKSAGSKFAAGLGRVGPEDRIRHWSRWNGAGRTGRHSGRGFQPHSMARPVRCWRNFGNSIRT
jgi:DNA polymerase